MTRLGSIFRRSRSGEVSSDEEAAHLHRMLTLLDGGYYFRDLQTDEEEFSPELRKLLGLGEEELAFNQFGFVFDPESYTVLQTALQAIQVGGEPIQLKVHTHDHKRYLDCQVMAEKDGQGKVQGIIFWFRDATKDQLKLQRLARESETLKMELKMFSNLLNAIGIPIWRRGDDLTIRYCNLAYSEAAEENPEKVVDAEELELHRYAKDLAKQALYKGESQRERRHIVVSGERKLYEITETPYPKDAMLAGYAIDMTEIEQVQEELQRHISAQTDLLESSTSAMAIYTADMKLQSYNFAYANLWKLEETWLDTKPTYSEVLEVLREKRRLPEQANFPAFKQQQLRLFTDLIAPQEGFFYLPDGKTLRVISIPHALGGILFAYEDVTDRLALERSYNTLIAVQRATLDNLHEGVVVFGENGRLQLYNPVYQKLWQLSDSFLSSEPHIGDILEATKALYHFEDWGSFKQQQIIETHLREVKHQRLERADDSVIDMITVPLPDGATLITYTDVTDSTLVERSLRERNEALQEADRLKTEFLANVSYELRSPLTSIIGFSEMLKQKYFGDLSKKQLEYVEGIYNSSQHLMHLINDILDLASIEAGFMRLEVTTCNVNDLLSSMLPLIKERTKEFNIKFTFECPKDIGQVLCDGTRLKQAIFNLLNNALKYTANGGKVTLGAKNAGEDEIMLWVEDNGAGIPPEEQEAVFQKFYKGKAADATKATGHKSGTGLGLPMVKSFIELHGGRVELESKVNKGTKVTCYLPRHNPALQQLKKM